MLSIVREICMILFPQKFTLKAISDRQIKRLRNDGATIGQNVDLINAVIESGGCGCLLKIGDNVTITNSRILLHDASTKRELGYTKVGHVTIGSDVFIGLNSVILPNTTIGNRVIIGAGCIVAHDIPDNSVVVGNPGGGNMFL